MTFTELPLLSRLSLTNQSYPDYRAYVCIRKNVYIRLLRQNLITCKQRRQTKAVNVPRTIKEDVSIWSYLNVGLEQTRFCIEDGAHWSICRVIFYLSFPLLCALFVWDRLPSVIDLALESSLWPTLHSPLSKPSGGGVLFNS